MNRSSSAGRGVARPATPQVRRAKVDDSRVGKGPGRKSTAPVDVEPELTRIREEDTDSFDAEEKAARQDTLLEERDVTLKQDSEKTSQKHESEPAEEDLSSGHVRDARGSAKENLEGLYRRQVRAVPKKTEIGQQPQQLRPGAVSGISFIASRHVAAIDGQGELASMVRHGADYKPDQARQNANSRQLWLNAVTSTLASDDVMFDPDKEQCHQEQQEVLQRLMLTLLCARFLKGDQNTQAFSPVLDTPLVSLISSGQRLGLEFDSVETAERFQTFLLTGDEHADLDAVINSRAAKNRKGRSPINKNRPDSPAGIFKRISTHSQKVDKEGFWKEVSATGEGGAYGMNFPMGGIGNIVVDDKTGEHRIGYEGLFNSGRQQWGTLLVKLSTDRKTDSGYMMVGVEGTGPYMKNHIGADHGVVASVKARFGKIGGTSVTGQDKGKVHGVMESKGGTRTRIYQSSLENVKSCWQELKQLDPEEQATVLDKLLKADNSDARHELRSILQEV